ncbi:MAG: hypothetical protein ACLP3R_06355, partial [Candidatus Korobacteraceae bacterium]
LQVQNFPTQMRAAPTFTYSSLSSSNVTGLTFTGIGGYSGGPPVVAQIYATFLTTNEGVMDAYYAANAEL